MNQNHRNRQVRGEIGFNRRVSVSVPPGRIGRHATLDVPKLAASVFGIESARFDFDNFLPLENQKRRDAVKRHLVTFPATFKNLKKRDPGQRDFPGKKVI